MKNVQNVRYGLVLWAIIGLFQSLTGVKNLNIILANALLKKKLYKKLKKILDTIKKCAYNKRHSLISSLVHECPEKSPGILFLKKYLTIHKKQGNVTL